MTDSIKLTHPASKKAIETTPDYVEMYRSQGWQTAEDKKSSDTEPAK